MTGMGMQASFRGKVLQGVRVQGVWSEWHEIEDRQVIYGRPFSSIDEEEAEDLLEEIREEVRRRDRGNSVVLEVSADCAPEAVAVLEEALQVDSRLVFQVEAPLALPDLGELAKPLRGRPDLQDVSFTPAASPAFDLELDPFDVIRANDVLLHHPYESFDPVVALLERAASDPDVLAIKQTLYRTSNDSPIVKALGEAAEAGKCVPVKDKNFDLGHGDVVIAAITSCTNTSNPYVMVGAGVLARNPV